MDKKINSIIKKYSNDELSLNKLVVTSYARCNNLIIEGGFLNAFVSKSESDLDADISILAKKCTLEDVINIFELAIPTTEITINGAVYTPKYIRDYIVLEVMQSTQKQLKHCLCADISCGCGAFLFSLADYIYNHTNLTYKEVIHNLFGVDISIKSIGRAKILLALAALSNGEVVNDGDFNLFCNNSLVFDFMSIPRIRTNGGIDIIVGNPPYVRSKHIDMDTKQYLPLWKTSSIGNADLYIPFFEIGISILTPNGILGYITVNTFFKSVNARALRNYLSDNNISLSIIDFGEQLVFKKKLAYTCMVFLSKELSESLSYAKAEISEIQEQKDIKFSRIHYASLNNHKGWHLNRKDVLENIHIIENAGEALGDKYIIKNGIATLANDVFIFRPVREDDFYYYLNREGAEYKIEKDICRNIIKPNILKTEAEIPEKEEKIITPYDAECKVIKEDFFISNYPFAYNYLTSCREILDARDKGEGNYDAWYAFGRTQAIADYGRKLLFPYMSDYPHFVYTPQKDMMIYCGYAIYCDSESELLFLKKILESSVFDYYMKNTSKPYSTGYYSYAKNYVKSFGIYPFTEEQKKHLLKLQRKEDVNSYITSVYGLSL